MVRRSATASLLALVALTALQPRSAADEELTIELPPSPLLAQAAEAPQSNPVVLTQRKAAPAPKSGAAARRTGTSASLKRFGSRRGQVVDGTKQYTVGRLGVATRAAAIRAARGSNRTQLSKVPAGTYLALNCENGAWYGVLMADRTTGWVKKIDVKMLEYEVVSNRQSDATAFTASGAPGMNIAAALNGGQKTILDLAYGYLGVPYRWGGTSPNGLDCSALVQRCFSSVGVRLPRTAREQINVGLPISSDQLQAADRVYFANASGAIVHTGIYIGNGYFIHASSKHKGVTVSNLSEDLYTRMYAGARR